MRCSHMQEAASISIVWLHHVWKIGVEVFDGGNHVSEEDLLISAVPLLNPVKDMRCALLSR